MLGSDRLQRRCHWLTQLIDEAQRITASVSVPGGKGFDVRDI
jgi:hypothetical protein